MAHFPGWHLLAKGIARCRSLLRGVRRRDDVEAEMYEEFRQHIELRTADLMRTGLARDVAARQARVEFGNMDTHREDARAARGLRTVDQIRFSWLDVKLGLRMIVKHPVLSVTAAFALAVGIPIGIAPAHVARAIKAPLPEDPENRIRGIRLFDPATSNVAGVDYEDFRFWSQQLASYSTLAAFQTSSYNVASEDGRAAPVSGARMTAGAFEILRTVPHLGRPLLRADDEFGAPDVVVLSHALWNARFASDPAIVGRTVRIGRTPHVVVGVMPPDFRFPANEQLWLPLRAKPAGGVHQAIPVRVFGRLADDVTPERAQAEIDASGLPLYAATDETRRRLRPEVVAFGLTFIGLPRGGVEALPEFVFVQLLTLLVLLVACVNVAMLVYARTATRFREMAIRTAIGASRSRIIAQIFVETLVIAVLAAGLGVVAIDWLLRHVNIAALAGEAALPYWLTLGVSRTAVFQALGLAAVSATVAGVIPALRLTRQAVNQSLRERSGIRFGSLTGTLIVADIAISVAAVGLALSIGAKAFDLASTNRLAGIPSSEYLAVEFRMPRDAVSTDGSGDSSQAATQNALIAALLNEATFRRVAVADALPGMEHRSQPFEIDGAPDADDASLEWVRWVHVDPGYFGALDQRVVSGRDFSAGDAEAGRNVVIVNSAFVELRLNGADPIGRRVRFPRASDDSGAEWRTIVGVVGHLGVNMLNAEHGDAVYVPTAVGQMNPLLVGLHVGPSPERAIERVNAVASRVDPSVVVGAPLVLSSIHQGDWYLTLAVAVGLMVMAGVLVLLAASGIYAMLSLSVTERTREIGIRAALGASRQTLVLGILRRSLVQICSGAAIGLPVAARVVYENGGSVVGESSPGMSVLVAVSLAAVVILAVSLFSFSIPTKRVLAIEASEAMRSEG